MEIDKVEVSYARWAPVYDKTFGAVTEGGRRKTVEFINAGQGSVLEVGVGTGLALKYYEPHLKVTGIDFSDDMLAKARSKVQNQGMTYVQELRQMDARSLDFPDNHFDTIAAMHVLSVVPEPEKVMAEIARVCRPGGQVVIANHFKRTKGVLAVIERLSAPFSNLLGWHSDFEIERVLQETSLEIELQKPHPPIGMMTLLVLRKTV